MTIPDKAIEEAVPRIADRLALLDIHDPEEAENMAHEVLEAAAPFLRAQALQEAADESQRLRTNAHEWLRALATQMEDQ